MIMTTTRRTRSPSSGAGNCAISAWAEFLESLLTVPRFAISSFLRSDLCTPHNLGAQQNQRWSKDDLASESLCCLMVILGTSCRVVS